MRYWPRTLAQQVKALSHWLHDRTPPRNIEIEQALLSALLTNNKAFDKVSDFLRPDHFAEPVHGRIYDAINKMIDLGKTADALTLRDYFDDDGALEEVGGDSTWSNYKTP